MNTPYKYKYEFGHLSIVSRLESGYNVFNTLQEAKEYGCQNPFRIHFYELSNFRERLRMIKKQELFDELFESLEMLDEMAGKHLKKDK